MGITQVQLEGVCPGLWAQAMNLPGLLPMDVAPLKASSAWKSDRMDC